MGSPETYPSADGASEEAEGASAPAAGGVVRPGTGVVRPGTGVVRPGTGVVAPSADAAKARAAVPEAPETPLEPIHVVLPVIPVKPVKQGFLDRLVAPKKDKDQKDKDQKDRDQKDKDQKDKKDKKKKAKEEAPPEPEEFDEDLDEYFDEEEDDAGPPVSPPVATPPAPPMPAAAPPPPPPPPPLHAPPVRPETRPRPEGPPPRPDGPPLRVDGPAPRAAAGAPAPPDVRPPEVRPPETRPPARPAPSGPPRPAPAPPGGWAPEAPPRPGPPPGRPGRGPRMGPPRLPGGLRPRRQRRPERDLSDWDEAPQRPARRGRWLAAAAAVTVISLGAGAATASLAPKQPGTWLPATASGSVAPVLEELGTDAPRPAPAALAAKIQSLFGDASLGGYVTASVVDVATGAPVFDLGGSTTVAPASTAKLLTAAAVLSARGPAYRLPTRAVAGSQPGQVILVGGGDPTLAQGATGSYPGAARLDQLADQVKKALGGTAPTSVVVDSSLFVGATFAGGWLVQDAKDGFISNITALMTDGARRNAKQVRAPAPRFDQPDLAAGQQFARLLGVPANQVTLVPGAASGQSQQLGVVESPPIARLVEIMLGESDNIVAEALARQIALARGVPASFEGAADATMDALRELGLPTTGYHLADGSGLSHLNRVSAQLLTAVLVHAASSDRPELRAILSGLPVAAYSGTLADRFRSANNGGAAAGVVRAKTGTLGGFRVSALAGVAVDADGRLLAFSIVTNGATNTFAAQNALDRIAAAIASCGCS